MQEQNSAFDFGVRVDAEVIVDVLIVVPHGLTFSWNEAGVEAV